MNEMALEWGMTHTVAVETQLDSGTDSEHRGSVLTLNMGTYYYISLLLFLDNNYASLLLHGYIKQTNCTVV